MEARHASFLDFILISAAGTGPTQTPVNRITTVKQVNQVQPKLHIHGIDSRAVDKRQIELVKWCQPVILGTGEIKLPKPVRSLIKQIIVVRLPESPGSPPHALPFRYRRECRMNMPQATQLKPVGFIPRGGEGAAKL